MSSDSSIGKTTNEIDSARLAQPAPDSLRVQQVSARRDTSYSQSARQGGPRACEADQFSAQDICALKKTASFEFQVPAHTALPRLHGRFQSSVPGAGSESASDDSANVDLLLLNADQYADFSRGGGEGTALYTVEPTHDHEVVFLLSPTQEDSATYYVVFRNSPGGAPSKQVKADFTLTFGYQ